MFRDVSLTLKPAQLLQLTGPNGSGKSSLLRLIAGLNEQAQAPDARPGRGEPELTIGQQAHYIAHQEAVKAALTVSENLALLARLPGRRRCRCGTRCLRSYPAHLSRGAALRRQKRRLALARLVLVPRVLWLLDEPTVGLNAASLDRPA